MKTKQAVLAGLAAGALFALFAGVAMTLALGEGSFWDAIQGRDPRRIMGKAVGPLVAGVFFGTSIGLILARVGKQLSIPEGETPEWCFPTEVLLRQGPANHWRGAINYGGWLYLTNTRLRFVPHRIMQSQDPQEWSLEEVGGVELVRTLLVVPNGLSIRLADESEQRFVVRLSERDDLRNAIDDARAAVQIGPPPSTPESE
jgi:hypothetical protein